jgi:hypothetical protein
MSYRTPTFQERFPLSHKIDLVKQQSEHFVNNSLSMGGLTAGLKGIPTNIPIIESLSNEMPADRIAESLIGTYCKNHWKVMLTCVALGAAAIYLLIKIDEENQKKKKKKITFLSN